MGSDVTPFGLRMPEELRRRITRSAKAGHRSLNAELVLRLRDSVAQESRRGDDETPMIGPEEKLLLEHFDSLSPARQKALIALLARDESEGKE
jgi:hypothetical protein